MHTPRAAIVIVGNEVLSAKVRDENGPWAAERLRDLGVRLAALVTIPDDVELVAEAVSRERQRVDWLFTSGGVGPTHDDVTVPAVAKALGRRLRRHRALEGVLREGHRRWLGADDDVVPDALLKMADVPEGTRLAGDPGHPVLVADNVVMLPGVPRFFRMQFDAFVAAELGGAAPFRLASAFLSLREDEFAALLDRVAREHPDVEIGSYPRFDPTDHAVRVTFEAKDAGRVVAARAAFLSALPAGGVVRIEGP
jgi:molybdenum cofactor synthesis domain-containing protein